MSRRRVSALTAAMLMLALAAGGASAATRTVTIHVTGMT